MRSPRIAQSQFFTPAHPKKIKFLLFFLFLFFVFMNRIYFSSYFFSLSRVHSRSTDNDEDQTHTELSSFSLTLSETLEKN